MYLTAVVLFYRANYCNDATNISTVYKLSTAAVTSYILYFLQCYELVSVNLYLPTSYAVGRSITETLKIEKSRSPNPSD